MGRVGEWSRPSTASRPPNSPTLSKSKRSWSLSSRPQNQKSRKNAGTSTICFSRPSGTARLTPKDRASGAQDLRSASFMARRRRERRPLKSPFIDSCFLRNLLRYLGRQRSPNSPPFASSMRPDVGSIFRDRRSMRSAGGGNIQQTTPPAKHSPKTPGRSLSTSSNMNPPAIRTAGKILRSCPAAHSKRPSR